MKPHLAGLPHEQDVLTTWPLYALRRSAADKEFEAFANQYYIQPLNREPVLKEHRHQLRRLILETFFAQDGSLKELFSLDDDMRKKVIDQQKYVIPVTPPPRLAGKLLPYYQMHARYEEWLRQWLQGYGRKLLQDVLTGDDFSVELPRQAGELAQRISRMMQAVANRIRKHEATEIVTIVRETDLAGSLAEDTERWFRDLLQKDNKPMIEANSFSTASCCRSWNTAVRSRICWLFATTASKSTRKAAKSIWPGCPMSAAETKRSRTDCQSGAGLSVFPLRVAMTDQEESAETLVIGNAANQLFEPLTKRLAAKQLLTEDKNRIEILRVSKPFAHDQFSMFQD